MKSLDNYNPTQAQTIFRGFDEQALEEFDEARPSGNINLKGDSNSDPFREKLVEK